jgi:hypothetical protein
MASNQQGGLESWLESRERYEVTMRELSYPELLASLLAHTARIAALSPLLAAFDTGECEQP